MFYSGTQAAVVNNDRIFVLLVSVDKGYRFCNIEKINFEITKANEIYACIIKYFLVIFEKIRNYIRDLYNSSQVVRKSFDA